MHIDTTLPEIDVSVTATIHRPQPSVGDRHTTVTITSVQIISPDGKVKVELVQALSTDTLEILAQDVTDQMWDD